MTPTSLFFNYVEHVEQVEEMMKGRKVCGWMVRGVIAESAMCFGERQGCHKNGIIYRNI